VRAATTVARTVGVGAGGEIITTTVVPIALININATSVTIARITSWAVRASATGAGVVGTLSQRITTTVWCSTALVNVVAVGLASTSVVLWAVRALIVSWKVGADCVSITRSWVITFVDINTAIVAIASVAMVWAVTACARSCGVRARNQRITAAIVEVAFVHIGATSGTRTNVTQWARATRDATLVVWVVLASNKGVTIAILGIALRIVAARLAGTRVVFWARTAIRRSWNVVTGSQLIAITVLH